MIRPLLLYFFFFFLGSSCHATLEPDAPFDVFTPPAWYKTEWNWAWTNCGSKVLKRPERTYESITWYKVHAPYFLEHGDVADIGLYEDGRIYLSENWLDNVRLVRHESLHAQGVSNGAKRHPQIFFDCDLLEPGTVSRGRL